MKFTEQFSGVMLTYEADTVEQIMYMRNVLNPNVVSVAEMDQHLLNVIKTNVDSNHPVAIFKLNEQYHYKLI